MSIVPRHDSDASGYLHADYAASFVDVARPRELPHCGGWILERNIPGTDLSDAMGCYPVFTCRDWRTLSEDLRPLADRLVSLTIVMDPFVGCTAADLRVCFDVVVPFKEHYVTDLKRLDLTSLPRRHRRNFEKARRSMDLETCENPLEMVDEWTSLYQQLVERRAVQGIAAFSRNALQKQLTVPGLRMFKASAKGQIVGLHLWYVNRQVAYGHLGATNEQGYQLMASYALYGYAIERFRDEVRWLDLGAGPGSTDDPRADGLRQFKAGWSTETRPAYLCGRIFQPAIYSDLVAQKRIGATAYFPAYRDGEFLAGRGTGAGVARR